MNRIISINDYIEETQSGFCKSERERWLDDKSVNPVFRPGKLVLLGSQKNTGKTQLMLALVNHFGVRNNIPVSITSTDLSNREVLRRLVCLVGKKNVTDDVSGYRFFEKDANSAKLKNKPIFLLNIQENFVELENDLRKVAQDKGIKVFFIENLEHLYLDSSHKNVLHEAESLEIAQKLKVLARELNVCIVLACTLPMPKRYRRPMVKDLPYGTELKKISTILLVHRPEYYVLLTEDTNIDKSWCKALLYLVDGKSQTISLMFNIDYGLFKSNDESFPYLLECGMDGSQTL